MDINKALQFANELIPNATTTIKVKNFFFIIKTILVKHYFSNYNAKLPLTNTSINRFFLLFLTLRAGILTAK